MSTSYDTNAEHELDQGDAAVALVHLRRAYRGLDNGAEEQSLARVIAALEAFAAGSTNIVPEE